MNLKPNDSFIDQAGGKTYRVNSQIGFGTYGIVYLVEEVRTNQKYALKLQNQITQQEFNLLEMLVKRRFTNLVNTISFGQYQNRYPYSVMEYCRENLYETITQKGTITNEQFRYVAHQIATGLKELHDLGLIHRDIKPENIMQFDHVDEVTKKVQKTYKICDFGLVMQQDSAKTQFSGTPYYIAPEQLQKEAKNYTNKVDIWALGAVFFELVQGQPLFQAHTQEQIYDLIKNSQIDDKINKLILKPEYKRLIRDMLNREPIIRPNIQEVLLKLSSQIFMKPTQIHQTVMQNANTIASPELDQSRQKQLDLINSHKKKAIETGGKPLFKVPIQTIVQQQGFNKQQNQQIQPRREVNAQQMAQNYQNISNYCSPPQKLMDLMKQQQTKPSIQTKVINKDIMNLPKPDNLYNQNQTLVLQEGMEQKQQIIEHNLIYQKQISKGQSLAPQEQQQSIQIISRTDQRNQDVSTQPQTKQLVNQQITTLVSQQRVPREISREEHSKPKIITFLSQERKLGGENKIQFIPNIPIRQNKEIPNLPHPNNLHNKDQTAVPKQIIQNLVKLQEYGQSFGEKKSIQPSAYQVQNNIQNGFTQPQTQQQNNQHVQNISFQQNNQQIIQSQIPNERMPNHQSREQQNNLQLSKVDQFGQNPINFQQHAGNGRFQDNIYLHPRIPNYS